MTLHQVVPVFGHDDAIGRSVELLRERLRRRMPGSVVLTEKAGARPDARGQVNFREFEAALRPDDVLLYHAWTSSPINEWLRDLPQRVVVLYHNAVTPELFTPWSRAHAAEMAAARSQLSALSQSVDLAITLNGDLAADLGSWGYANVAVAALPVDLDWVTRDIDVATRERLQALRGEGPALLFAGRLGPHKAPHDLLRAFAVIQRVHPTASMWLVGEPMFAAYGMALEWYRDALGLQRVEMLGWLDRPALAAAYASADVYWSLSKTEGQPFPLAEAMAAGLPVVALGCAQMLDGGGIAVDSADPALVSAAVEGVVVDPQPFVARGRQRVAAFDAASAGDALIDLVLGGAG